MTLAQLTAYAFAALALAALPAAAQQPMRSVNVTADSAPGWLPTEEQERLAQQVALAFLQAKDQGRYADAHALMSPGMKAYVSLDALTSGGKEFNATAGALVARNISKVTWTKDPANAPGPGVYSAIDVVTRYANVDRHCGYIVVYQQPSGGSFLVMREEKTFIDNDSAAKIAAGGQNVDQLWAQISRVCPNYSPARPMS